MKLLETITPEAISALPSGDGQALGYNPSTGTLVRIDTAHSYRSHTVAELYAYTDATRPAIPLPCSDCLTTRGVGANCCWDVGAQVWRTTEGTTATTDLWVFYRSLALDRPVGTSTTRKMAFGAGFGLCTATSGAGAYPSASAPPSGVSKISTFTTGTLAAGYSFAGGSQPNSLVNTSNAESFYMRFWLGVGTLSDATETFSLRVGGNGSPAAALSANEVGVAYDKSNALGGLNAAANHNLILYSRKASANTLVDTGVTLVGATHYLVEILSTATELSAAINGTTVPTAIPASAVPASQLMVVPVIAKSAGTTSRSGYCSDSIAMARYTS